MVHALTLPTTTIFPQMYELLGGNSEKGIHYSPVGSNAESASRAMEEVATKATKRINTSRLEALFIIIPPQ